MIVLKLNLISDINLINVDAVEDTAMADDIKMTSSEIADQVVAKLSESEKFSTLLTTMISQVLDTKLREAQLQLDKKIATLNTDYEKIRGEIHDVVVKNDELKEQVDSNNENLKVNISNINNLHRRVCSYEQASYLNGLRITGVPESAMKRDQETNKIIPEDVGSLVQDVISKTGVSIKEDDIDIVARIPKSKQQKNTATPRVIEVKFTRHTLRQKVLLARRKLKGTGIGINEILTSHNKYLYDEARNMATKVDKVKAVWTWDGIPTILVQEDNGHELKYKIRSVEDIQRVAEKYS